MRIFGIAILGRVFKAALMVCGFLLGIGALAEAQAGYPSAQESYPAPWVDGYTFDNTSGTYACLDDSVGGVEGCSVTYWDSHNHAGTFQNGPWVALTPSNCQPYTYLNTNCYQTSFAYPDPGTGNPVTENFTIVGQRCVYPAASGYLFYIQSTPGGISQPGWCIGTIGYVGPERNAGCPKCILKGMGIGDPINPPYGNVYEDATDYRGHGPFPLVFTRSYNTVLANEPASVGGATQNLGSGWTANAMDHLHIEARWPLIICKEPNSPFRYYTCPSFGYTGTPDLEITVWHPDGSQALFNYPGLTVPDGTALTPEERSNGQLFYVATLPSPLTGSGYRYARDDASSEFYDTNGRLLMVQDSGGLQQTYAYDTSGHLTTITDPAGRSLAFTYDASNRLQTMTDPAGKVYTYTYDAHNNLASVTYPDSTNPSGVVLTYKYENTTYTHALTGVVDENNSRYATWGYDGVGRATSSYLGTSTLKASNFTISLTTDSGSRTTSATVTQPNSQRRTLNFTTDSFIQKMASDTSPCVECGDPSKTVTYDANGFISSITDFNNHVTQYTHDATGLETSRTEAYGTAYARTIGTNWDNNLRQPVLISEPGRTTAFTHDAVGHVLTKTVTDTATGVARTTTYTYNPQGLLATVDWPRTDVSDVTTYGYTANGDLSSITNALGQVTQITAWDAHGNPATIVDPNGVIIALAYDARQRIVSKTVNGAELTQFAYDNAGELTRITQPDGSYLQYSYDSAHRLTGVTDNLGNTVVYTLDKLGNRTMEQTKNSSGTVMRTLSRTYDNLNRLHQLIGGVSQTTTYGYDNLRNITGITDPLTHLTSQVFDDLDRLQSVTDPMSGTNAYTEDALDHVTDVVDPRGLHTHYDYDAFGDVTEQDSPDTGITSYTYDLAGNRLTKTDAASVTAAYTYDALNRLTSVSYPDITKDVTYSYDSGTYGKGHLTGIADASGTTAYTYDAYGNLTQKVVVEGGQTFTVGYGYDLANNLYSVTYPDGMVVAYSRDADGRITGVTENGNAMVSGIGYKPFGPVSGLTYGNGLIETRSYDLDYRLTGISIPAIQGLTFGYNANDDITGITDSISASNTQTLGYDSLNRLTSAVSGSGGYGSLTYGYDADGNRTSLINGAGTATYTLDTNNNQLDSISGATTATYGYNAIGALDNDGTNQYTYADTERLDTVTNISTSATVATYVYNGLGQRTGKTTGTGTSLFVYDEDGQLLGEYDGSGNRVQEHIWLNHRPIGVVNSTALYYVQTDQLNTPRVITDASHAVVWSWNSDPFGNASTTGSLTYNLRFPGQYFDAETGHNYNYFRDYDTTTNRYIESDPTGLEGGLNGYIYADDNPFTEIDVSGLCPSSFDTGYGVGAVYVSRGLPGNCSLNQLRSRVFGPLVRTSGSCSCGDKTMTCTYSLAIDYQERSKNYNCKTHAASGNWSGYGNSMPGPPHDFTFTIDCATNKAISVSTGNITRPL